MITKSKQDKMAAAIKAYAKKYLHGKLTELDESGTRLMINSFLSDILGFAPIEEIKTEYMIRGTYADYVIQLGGTRHFLVEVKALSFELSEKHLRQAINYGANEGIEWALLTNGRQFDFYKILFNKPIESQLVFSFNLSDAVHQKKALEIMQFLHRDAVANKGLDALWNRTIALDAKNIAGILFSPSILNHIKKTLKDKYKRKFTDEEVDAAICELITKPIKMDTVKPMRAKKEKKIKVKTISEPDETPSQASQQ